MADPNSPDGPNGIFVAPPCDLSGIEGISRTLTDLPYAGQSEFQKLDLYLPRTDPPKGGYPLIFFVHGGAWMMCDKSDIQLQPALEGVKKGYAVASVNYRLSSEALFPAQIHDVKAALRWLRGNSGKYLLNPEKVAAWGDSAGAHLVSLLGTSVGVEEMEDLSMGNAEESAEPCLVVSWFGPTDFLKMDPFLKESGTGEADHSTPESPESRLLGAPISKVPKLVKMANPETWLTENCPPFLFQHGSLDPIVPCQLSELFYRRITSLCGEDRAELDILEGAEHGGDLFETEENLERVFLFIEKHISRDGNS